MERAVIGVDGNCAYALLGENLQEGEVEFQMIALPIEACRDPNRYHKTEWCNAAKLAATAAYHILKDRLKGRQISYALDPSHPDYC